MKESEIQEKVTLFSISTGLLPIRINVVGRKGWPDYGYGYRSHMCFVEFKKPGEKPEPLQDHVHTVLRSYGFKVFVVDDVADGKAQLTNWKAEIDAS